jgi:uncharacterized protein (DUF58 family)
MDTRELLKKVRKLEIRTRALSSQIFSGQYHSAFKGRGMAFSEVREYQHGDEIRTIDWNVTARFNHPYVKVFEEERELQVILLIDISDSETVGTRQRLKKELITEIAAVLAFSAALNNDKVGAILFTDKIEKFIPPQKGRKHILHIISLLLNYTPQSKGTDVANALKYFDQILKKRSIAFIISDFFDGDFENSLNIINRRNDLMAIRVYDEAEYKLPNVGIIQMRDNETGLTSYVNTSLLSTRKKLESIMHRRDKHLEQLFRKAKVDYASFATNQNYIQSLMLLLEKHARKR